MDDQKKQRIGMFTAGIMLGIAFLFDLVQVPLTVTVILPTLVGWFAVGFFWCWFKLLDVEYFAGKRAGLKILALLGPAVMSAIPIVNDLPELTAGVLVTIVVVALEDKELVPASLAPLKKIYDRYRNQERIEKTYAVPAQPSVVPTDKEEY